MLISMVGLWARRAARVALLSAAVLAAFSPVAAWPADLPAGIMAERVAQYDDWATDFLWLSETELIVAGKRGYMVLYRNGNRVATLLDINERVRPAGGDRGTMGVAMDPKFREGRPYIYVGYTADPLHNGGMNYNMISRFTYQNERLVDERPLLGTTCRLDGSFQWDANCSPMPGNTHAIGSLWMPGDGALWASIGEGNIHDGEFWTIKYGYVGTDKALAMDVNFLGGKIIRINPDTGAGLRDNPFCLETSSIWSARCKVWAVGLRNPYRCYGTATTAWCGDVGWFTWESFKQIPRGGNTGWPCWEGNQIPPGLNSGTEICQRIYNGDNPYPAVTMNVLHQWNHYGDGAAVVGGVPIPSYYPVVGGKTVVADHVTGIVWAVGGGTQTFFRAADYPVAFRVGPDGWLYYMHLENHERGTVMRLRIPGFTPPFPPTKPRTTAKPVPTTTKPPPDPLCNPTKKIVVKECTVLPGQQPLDTVQYISREGWPENRRRFLRNGMWSSVGLDASVGNQTAGTGRTLSIKGSYYLTGYGTHSFSSIELTIDKCCFRMSGLVGVDDEVGRFYPQWKSSPISEVAGGEFVIRDGAIGSNQVIWNSTKKHPLYRIRYGVKALPFDVKYLNKFTKIRLEAMVPARVNPVKYSDYTPAHLDWVEPKLYCGSKAPYVPIIKLTQPVQGTIAKTDTNVSFAATATMWDGKTGIPLFKEFWKWDIRLIHCQGTLCHEHAVYQRTFRFKGVNKGQFLAFPHDDTKMQYYYWLVQLKVTDRCGNYDIVRRAVPMEGFLDMP